MYELISIDVFAIDEIILTRSKKSNMQVDTNK